MNGPEHYREAERLIEGIGNEGHAALAGMVQTGKVANIDMATGAIAAVVALAQVHATLALASATAYQPVKDYTGDEDGSVSRGWAGVA